MDSVSALQVEEEIIVVATAMEMEAAPFLRDLAEANTVSLAGQTWHIGTWNGRKTCVVITGIGLTNAASAAARAHLLFGDHLRAYICAGTTGGMAQEVNVTDAIVGTQFVYSRADATAFGYEPGQVPGLPAIFSAGAKLTQIASSLPSDVTIPTDGAPFDVTTPSSGQLHPEGEAETGTPEAQVPAETPSETMPVTIRVGQVASSDAFITDKTVEGMREIFPLALGADMESTAAAQVCALAGVEFLSVRGVSDLCGPSADQDFHVDGSVAAGVSVHVANLVMEQVL